MGVRAAFVVVTTSFLIGVLATHFVADSLTLWQSPATDARLWAAAQYYTLLAKAPSEMAFVLAGITTFGATVILWSLFDGRAGNLMFDGGSLFLYLSAISVYAYNVLPILTRNFINSPLSYGSIKEAPFPDILKKPTLELASSHLVCSVAMTGVLLLQAGRYWADGEDAGWRDIDSIPAEKSSAKGKSKSKEKEN
ncbi:hypothetical protein SISNIDRAFT_480508 [Sistotremastrum niveocremeum HHB9708]|uniref:Shr3 amino acid permease chaperone n=1 Tax=Sistotremastrum niveocremeum HHB9708 TaxID=1314777 RepID=A0A165AFF5_9AGAM|nr:hypothetical protein SISNIDRAFT_480508 [Sistotremastrum niveocremeum HHB9708]